jgi:non-ribosomal peptide synthetase component F
MVVINGYGPAETTISCNSKIIDGSGAVTVGCPERNVKEQIMDTDGNPLPVGVVGELWIGGAGV